ncbi:hypothetical protein [Lysobacter sp. Hz 25]|uniref:hypothetical protein n=1 Tax=Lysobacter sp. Hz 25 TaxID=3383698 RepID=UPI0038D38303
MDISSQTQLRQHGQPKFCYLCGESLSDGRSVDRDHCPPKGFFAPVDRTNFPIILPTHKACNNKWHGADELIGIITDALHTKKKSSDPSVTKKLDACLLPFKGGQAAAVTNVPLGPSTARIVRGMHALLYNEFLPLDTPSKFHVPLPEADVATGTLRQPLDQTFAFGSAIRKAIITGSTDMVRAYSGNFRYACTWERFENGKPFCIVAFDIYSFHVLSPKIDNFPKCFIGMYIPVSAPKTASWASQLEIKVSRGEMLDPLLRT